MTLPLLLILGTEVILRIFDYGENYELFNRVTSENGTEYYVMNSDISKKYFRNTGFRSDNQADLFLKEKTDDSFRIFVQGASTVVGFPFYKNGSFPRILKHRLSLTFPDKNIEVVNTGMTAVNSYTLWDLTEKIIEQDPDLVILYAGHNEYYGALGTGSTVFIGSHPFLVRTYLKLKNSRFFQLLENTSSRLSGSRKKEGYKVGETTLMEVMAREQQIPYNSEVFHDGIRQFQNNFEKIIAAYQARGIPVLISTLVSNQKDVPPFISEDLQETEFQEKIKNDRIAASETARHNARAAYLLARFYLGKQQDSAKKYFQLAKDLDQLRFRAPEKINEVIVSLSKEENVYLVDSRKFFEEASKSGFIDNELMTEHVHPNVKGNFLIADALYNEIKDLQLIGSWEGYIPYKEALQNIPITRIDSIRGKMIVADLKQSWPYKLEMSGRNPTRGYHSLQNPTYEERKAIGLYSGREKWEDVMRQAYHTYRNRGDLENALHVAQSLISEFPEQYRVYEMAGTVCMEMNKPDLAKFYFDKRDRLK